MTDPNSINDLDADQLRAAGVQLSRHLQRSGVRFLPRANEDQVEHWQSRFEVAEVVPTPVVEPEVNPTPAQPPVVTPPSPATHRLASVDAVQAESDSYSGPSLPLAQRQEQLATLAGAVSGCTLCPKLVACRTQTVFGEGNAEARFAFFGEGPGADEDRTGRPFIGKAGQLLTKMIEACHLSREETYILNTVKCRPPGNRNPEPDEVEQCRQYFEAQLACVRPEYIICLGAVAAQALLRSKLSVGRLRQRFHQYHDSKVLVIYHPAYLLRNPSAKKAAWADLQLLMRDAGL